MLGVGQWDNKDADNNGFVTTGHSWYALLVMSRSGFDSPRRFHTWPGRIRNVDPPRWRRGGSWVCNCCRSSFLGPQCGPNPVSCVVGGGTADVGVFLGDQGCWCDRGSPERLADARLDRSVGRLRCVVRHAVVCAGVQQRSGCRERPSGWQEGSRLNVNGCHVESARHRVFAEVRKTHGNAVAAVASRAALRSSGCTSDDTRSWKRPSTLVPITNLFGTLGL